MLLNLHDVERQRSSKRILCAITRSLIVFFIIAVIMILIVLLTPSPSVDAQEQWNNPCCKPICEPEPQVTETRVIFYPIYIREEVKKKEEVEAAECSNHFVELGLYANANEVGDTGFPSHNFLVGNIDLRSKRFQNFLDIAGGISFGYIQNQGAIGANLKLGVPFSNPGPSFDIVRATWMVNNSITLVSKRVGLRIPLLKIGPFGSIQALGYVGVEAFAFYSEATGYTNGYSFLLGAVAEVCREQFSFSFFLELQAYQQKWECSSHKGTVSLEVGAQLWLF